MKLPTIDTNHCLHSLLLARNFHFQMNGSFKCLIIKEIAECPDFIFLIFINFHKIRYLLNTNYRYYQLFFEFLLSNIAP